MKRRFYPETALGAHTIFGLSGEHGLGALVDDDYRQAAEGDKISLRPNFYMVRDI